MSRRAADVMTELLIRKPDCVLGLATGSTPVGLYRELVARCKAGLLSFRRVRTVNLDEYCGLAASHEQSYAFFMKRNLFDHIDIDPANTHLPDGTNRDEKAETARYDKLIDSLGGIDLQGLGIGEDGHIGFNEPSGEIPIGTSRVALTDSTIRANARFFDSPDDVPRYAYSMGCGEILNAGRILFLANGVSKADIVEEAFFGPVTPQVPASLLQLVPDKVTAFCDREAASVILKKHPGDVTLL